MIIVIFSKNAYKKKAIALFVCMPGTQFDKEFFQVEIMHIASVRNAVFGVQKWARQSDITRDTLRTQKCKI